MQILAPDVWATILDANPLPAGVTPDPRTWLPWYPTATEEQRNALYGAIVVLVAEQWADLLETALAAGIDAPFASLAMLALHRIEYALGPFAPDDFQLGCALTMLERTWVHGPALRTALEVQLLEAMAVTGAPS